MLQATAVASGAGTCTASAAASAFAEAVGNQCTASAVASAAASCLVSTTFSVATASAFAEVSQVTPEVSEAPGLSVVAATCVSVGLDVQLPAALQSGGLSAQSFTYAAA